MDKEDVAYLGKGILLSHNKESEKDVLFHSYVESKKQNKWTIGTETDSDTENEFPKGRGLGGLEKLMRESKRYKLSVRK